jgi:nucleoside-diphosphate-sugar epimerase
MSVTPAEIANEIRKQIPTFAIDYHVDPVRQAIAESWPRSLDDSVARDDWGWSPEFNLAAMTRDMLKRVGAKIGRVRNP